MSVCNVGALWWLNGGTDQDESWHADIGLGPDHIVLDADPASPPKRDTASQFSTHICCGQIAGWINVPLAMEVGLGPGDFVLDGDPAPLHKNLGGMQPSNFRTMSIVGKRLHGSRWHLAWM